MSRTRVALLGGPVFFVSWFMGAQILYFAAGGGPNGEPSPSAAEYPAAVLSNQFGVNVGATLHVIAAIGLILFGVGLKAWAKPRHNLNLFPVLAVSAVAVLLILESGLAVGSLRLAEDAPEISWYLRELSGTLGFESFMTSLLGGVALAGLIVAADRSAFSKWFWWFTVVFAVILTGFGLLEGLGVTPEGRFSILFGLWAFIAGFALKTEPSHEVVG